MGIHAVSIFESQMDSFESACLQLSESHTIFIASQRLQELSVPRVQIFFFFFNAEMY